jgi:hypothetical protein
MDLLAQQKLNIYVSKLEQIKEIVHNEQTAAILLLLTELTKGKEGEQISQKVVVNGNAPATENQKTYLFNLGTAVPEGLTRQQASVLIDTAKAEQQGMRKAIRMPIKIP